MYHCARDPSPLLVVSSPPDTPEVAVNPQARGAPHKGDPAALCPVALPHAEIAPPAQVAAGVSKVEAPWISAVVLGILAGMYISVGALLALSVGGSMPEAKEDNPGLQKIVLGLFGLPFGLFMVVITGADLFTGNLANTFAAFLARKVSALVR